MTHPSSGAREIRLFLSAAPPEERSESRGKPDPSLAAGTVEPGACDRGSNLRPDLRPLDRPPVDAPESPAPPARERFSSARLRRPGLRTTSIAATRAWVPKLGAARASRSGSSTRIVLRLTLLAPEAIKRPKIGRA